MADGWETIVPAAAPAKSADGWETVAPAAGGHTPTVADIPGAVAQPKAAPDASLWDKAKGAGEAGLATVTGIPAGLISEAQTAVEAPFKKPKGERYDDPNGWAAKRAAELTASRAYQPKTEKGQEYTANIARAVENSGIAGLGPAGAEFGGLSTMGKAAGAAKAGAKDAEALTAAKLSGPSARAIQKAKDAGLAMPPTQASPTLLNKLLEGIAGKTTTAQKISEKNAPQVNALTRAALGLPADEPITVQALEGIRAEAGGAYEAIKNVQQPVLTDMQYLKDINGLKGDFSQAAKKFPDLFKNEGIDKVVDSLNVSRMSTTEAVELIKKLRFDGNTLLKSRDNPQNLALGMASRKAADAVENLLDRKLEKMTGDPNMVRNFRDARQRIATSYDVEAALNESTGNVSATHFGKLLDKGKPLSGNLKDVAEFAKAFPKGAQAVEKIGSQPGISPLDVGVQMLRHGSGAGLFADLASLGVRPAARAAITSQPYQKWFVNPPKGATPASQNAINRARLGYDN